MVKIELSLSNKFLDTHTMSELEQKLWDWLERFEISQGDLQERNVKVKIVIEGDYFYDTKLGKEIC